MITQVSYARLYNTGNFENVRFEAVASVDDGNTTAAFTECRNAVHGEMAAWIADRAAAEQRKRDAMTQKRNLDNF